jgi:hypothetical protein
MTAIPNFFRFIIRPTGLDIWNQDAIRPRRVGALCLALGLLAVSCNERPKQTGGNAPADPFSGAVPVDRYADDLGRFLAGLPARAGSPFAGYETRPAWLKHREALDRAWARIEETSLPAMRAFQKQELRDAAVTRAPVLYPFSGPDALMATVFFPANPTYVMIGLEPAGTLPSPKQLGRVDLDEYLASVRATLASELGRSFFITRQMDRQFRGQVTDGLFLPLLELLARSGHTILGYRYMRLDDGGHIVDRAADYKAPGRIGNKGVEIEFQRDEDRSIHKLLYFSVNLADDSLRANQPFLTFADGLTGTATYLKATSYMVHHPEFSIIRERLLSLSKAVLQDDSGIPYHFFSPERWQVQLYGDYIKPYGSFRWLQQADLRKAYLETGVKPLNFRIGYGYGKVESNLLFARRRD